MIKYYYVRCNRETKLILSSILLSILLLDVSDSVSNNFFFLCDINLFLNCDLFSSVSYIFSSASSDDNFFSDNDVVSDKIFSSESDNFFNPS